MLKSADDLRTSTVSDWTEGCIEGAATDVLAGAGELFVGAQSKEKAGASANADWIAGT